MNVHNLIKLAFAIRRDFNNKLEEFDLTFNQWLILKEINMNGASTAQQLIERLSSDKATMSQCLKSLELKGFIAKVDNPSDRRSKIIEMQEQAMEYCHQVQRIEMEFNQALNQEFDSKDIAIFNEMCETKLSILQGEE